MDVALKTEILYEQRFHNASKSFFTAGNIFAQRSLPQVGLTRAEEGGSGERSGRAMWSLWDEYIVLHYARGGGGGGEESLENSRE